LLQKTGDQPEQETVVTPDTTKPAPAIIQPVENDSTVDIIDSLAVREWKAYISQTKSLFVAEERLKKYKGYGHNAFLETVDSNNHFIYILLPSTLLDTAGKRDSLTRFFGFPVKLESVQ
jgi:hypothetical protein